MDEGGVVRTSYDYAQRQGVDEIGWDRFAALAAALAEELAAAGVQAIVGVARAGLFPATAAACALRCELHPVRVTRRVDDRVTYAHPRWVVDVPVEVQGWVVAVVDEIADTGETLALVASRARERGAARVVTAALVSHSWADPAPDLVALVSDALIVFPWDRRVYQDGAWQLHPELAAALRLQERGLAGE
jgi:hypoxanthine phosphoribosyltransferase